MSELGFELRCVWLQSHSPGLLIVCIDSHCILQHDPLRSASIFSRPTHSPLMGKGRWACFPKNHEDSRLEPHLSLPAISVFCRIDHFFSSFSSYLLLPHRPPLVLSFFMNKMSILPVGIHGMEVGALHPLSPLVAVWLRAHYFISLRLHVLLWKMGGIKIYFPPSWNFCEDQMRYRCKMLAQGWYIVSTP